VAIPETRAPGARVSGKAGGFAISSNGSVYVAGFVIDYLAGGNWDVTVWKNGNPEVFSPPYLEALDTYLDADNYPASIFVSAK